MVLLLLFLFQRNTIDFFNKDGETGIEAENYLFLVDSFW